MARTIRNLYPNDDFSNSGYREDPVTTIRDGLVGEFQLGRNIGTSVINMAELGGEPSTAPGTPNIANRYATVTNNKYFVTPLRDDSDEMTLVVVSAFQDGQSQILLSSLATISDSPVGFDTVGTTLRAYIQTSAGQIVTESALTADALYSVKMMVVTAGSGAVLTTANYRSGTLLATASTTGAAGATHSLTNKQFSIGGAQGSTDTARVYAALKYNRALDATERLALAADISTIAAGRGITV